MVFLFVVTELDVIRPLPEGGLFMVSPCSFPFRSVPEKSALGWCPEVAGSDSAPKDGVYIVCMGGADRTFACKSQESLWQDWYICR